MIPALTIIILVLLIVLCIVYVQLAGERERSEDRLLTANSRYEDMIRLAGQLDLAEEQLKNARAKALKRSEIVRDAIDGDGF